MLEYKITNSDLWYRIYKTEDEWETKYYYDVKWGWSLNKTRAKIFFHREDVMSALVIIKAKWEKIEETSNAPKPEKQSWSELS